MPVSQQVSYRRVRIPRLTQKFSIPTIGKHLLRPSVETGFGIPESSTDLSTVGFVGSFSAGAIENMPPLDRKMTHGMFLRIEGVERRLNVSRSSVYRLIRAGELDVVHIGAAIRISEESLDSFVATHTTFGTAVAR